MLKWTIVNAATAGIEEYKHHQRLKHRSYFTEDNMKIILFILNTITVIRGFYNS